MTLAPKTKNTLRAANQKAPAHRHKTGLKRLLARLGIALKRRRRRRRVTNSPPISPRLRRDIGLGQHEQAKHWLEITLFPPS